jgi:hypothetical protein
MPLSGIADGFISALLVTPFVVVLTYYFDNAYNYYFSLYHLVDEIESNMEYLRKFPQLIEEIKKKAPEKQWLPKGTSIKVANLVQKKKTLELCHNKEFPIKERAFLYNFLLDDAYVIFVGKGYHQHLQNQMELSKGSALKSFLKKLESLRSESYGKHSIRGGIFERISRFYLYCNQFDFKSQQLEESDSLDYEMNNLYNEYFCKILNEYSGINVCNLKRLRFLFCLCSMGLAALAMWCIGIIIYVILR